MSIFVRILLAFAFFAFASPSFAQATRTWVSGVGDDVNPCSRTAPCKTFAGAISKTAAGGEINCLDPGGFGAVTITKSITLDCTGTLGSILNSATSGITINDSLTAAPGTIEVIVRGITIDGAGSTPGQNGIRFISGASLTLRDVFVQNQRGVNGIAIQPTRLMRFHADHVTVTNGNIGILIQPTGATGQARVVLRNVLVDNNSSHGLNIDSTGATSTGANNVVIEHSSFSRNGGAGVRVQTPVATLPSVVMLTDSVVANNVGAGLITNGANATMRVAFTTITGNQGGGVNPAGGSQMLSFGNNRNAVNPLQGAANNGTFTGAVLPTQ